jgi:hypothetical protein
MYRGMELIHALIKITLAPYLAFSLANNLIFSPSYLLQFSMNIKKFFLINGHPKILEWKNTRLACKNIFIFHL